MPTLTFEGDSHRDIIRQVEAWLASAKEDKPLKPTDVVEQGAQLTKDALKVIAASAPEPVADSELVKALTEVGYRATDLTSGIIVESLEQLQDLTGDAVIKQVRSDAASAVYKMNAGIAKQIIKTMAAQQNQPPAKAKPASKQKAEPAD